MATAPRKTSTTRKKSTAKSTTTKATAAKHMAKSRKPPAAKSRKKPAAKSAPASRRAADRTDKSVEDFREALERSVTLSRERIQEVVDDSVKRGRMTRDDANEMVSKLLARGRKQTEDLVAELERLLEGTGAAVGGRAKAARDGVGKGTTKARTKAGKAAGRVAKGAREAADEPLAQADKLRRRAGVGPGFPILAYDDLSVAKVRGRLDDLGRPELRKVRTYESNNKARKGILGDIERRLG